MHKLNVMCIFSKYIEEDKLAREIAEKYGMEHVYDVARECGFSPKAALEDCDIYDPIPVSPSQFPHFVLFHAPWSSRRPLFHAQHTPQ